MANILVPNPYCPPREDELSDDDELGETRKVTVPNTLQELREDLRKEAELQLPWSQPVSGGTEIMDPAVMQQFLQMMDEQFGMKEMKEDTKQTRSELTEMNKQIAQLNERRGDQRCEKRTDPAEFEDGQVCTRFGTAAISNVKWSSLVLE